MIKDSTAVRINDALCLKASKVTSQKGPCDTEINFFRDCTCGLNLIVHSGHYSIHLSRIVCTVKKFCAAPILAFERNWGYTNIANDLTLIGIATNAVERKPLVSVLAIPLKRVMERFISYCLS